MATGDSPRPGHRVAGAILGLVVGAVVSLNVIVFLGTEQGYEASLSDVFAENLVVGIGAAALLVVGPVVGFFLAGKIFRTGQR